MAHADAIGIIDAGMGGYTVVREVQRLMPGQDILYYGDSKNQPYGNRSEDAILHMTRQILDVMREEQVKLVAVACNTISTLIEKYQDDYPFPIFSIVEAGAKAAAESGADKIGVISTVFTDTTGAYANLIKQKRRDITVVSRGCEHLARLIEHGNFEQELLDAEVKKEIDKVLLEQPVTHLVLGCTHYPYVRENIHRLYPGLITIDPAAEQAKILQGYLSAHENSDRNDGLGRFDVYTTGSGEVYRDAARRMTLYPPQRVEEVPAPNPEK